MQDERQIHKARELGMAYGNGKQALLDMGKDVYAAGAKAMNSLEAREELKSFGGAVAEVIARDEAEGVIEDMIDAHYTKSSMQRLLRLGKKPLAKEVLRLQGLMEGIKEAAKTGEYTKPVHASAEAFALMRYKDKDGLCVFVWNGRDGVTPFAFKIDGKHYQHDLRAMTGPIYDQPPVASHRWETLHPEQQQLAWERHLDRIKAHELKVAADAERAVDGNLIQRLAEAKKQMPAGPEFQIGLRNLITGKLVDE